MASHPNIKNLQDAVRKKEITPLKISSFEKWMNNPVKFKEEYRAEAEQVLNEAKQLMQSGQGDQGYRQNTQKTHVNKNDNLRGGKHIQEKYMNSAAADADVLGSGFHNPYTFIPFPAKAPERKTPTPLTIDEKEADRLTGILRVKLQSLSPLLVPETIAKSNQQNDKDAPPKQIPALRIGNDIAVPASSVRGVLRTLTAIISGSALDYVDDELYLCQGRDLQLNDREHLYLAEVVSPGSSFEDGVVAFGRAELIRTEDLWRALYHSYYDSRNDSKLRQDAARKQIWVNEAVSSAVTHRDAAHPYLVKVSGRKVNGKGTPHEGRFYRSQAKEIVLRKELWKEYLGRHRNAEKNRLKKGDLIWLEPCDPEQGIKDGNDVKSIQWARWGRQGVNFLEQLKGRLSHMIPDSLRNDGLVDITSDLFGSIPIPEKGASSSYEAFAARIRTENLVFQNAKTFWNEMAVMGAPHPGCKAFYLDNTDYDAISLQDLPRGYKVYRTSKHTPGQEPWKYSTQPIYNNPGEMKPFQQAGKQTKKCELLQQDSVGTLNISFRSLTQKELSLLLLVLSCDLRIGGGKPLGLGHCVVTDIKGFTEDGNEFLSWRPQKASLPASMEKLPAEYMNRAFLYCQTQVPVSMMRYPRAINQQKRGGMCYFAYFAAPKKGGSGLEAVGCTGELQQKAGNELIKAQGLPIFDPTNPESDKLFGYDLNGHVGYQSKNKKNYYSSFNFDTTPSGPKRENTSPNRFTRQQERNKR